MLFDATFNMVLTSCSYVFLISSVDSNTSKVNNSEHCCLKFFQSARLYNHFEVVASSYCAGSSSVVSVGKWSDPSWFRITVQLQTVDMFLDTSARSIGDSFPVWLVYVQAPVFKLVKLCCSMSSFNILPLVFVTEDPNTAWWALKSQGCGHPVHLKPAGPRRFFCIVTQFGRSGRVRSLIYSFKRIQEYSSRWMTTKGRTSQAFKCIVSISAPEKI